MSNASVHLPAPAAHIGAIWAQDRNGVLGANGKLLWHVPADFKHFKTVTQGGIVIMGRKTWESIGAALPQRVNLVLTHTPHWQAPGAKTVNSLTQAVIVARSQLDTLASDPRPTTWQETPRIWVIGGGSIYAQALQADILAELLITTVDLDTRTLAPPHTLIRAPKLPASAWKLDPNLSDKAQNWRPVSGQSAWRVDHWLRR